MELNLDNATDIPAVQVDIVAVCIFWILDHTSVIHQKWRTAMISSLQSADFKKTKLAEKSALLKFLSNREARVNFSSSCQLLFLSSKQEV